MKFLCAAFITLAGFSVKCWDSCKNRPKQDKIQSGAVTLFNDQNNNNCYSVNIQYDIPPTGIQVAVSSSNFNGFTSQNGINYSVRASRKPNANAINLSFLSKDPSWQKIDVSYMATSRDDLHLGNFIADTYGYFQCGAKNIGDKGGFVSTVIPASLPNTNNYGVATFLSGMKTKSNKVNARLSNAQIKQNQLGVKFITDSVMPIQNIHINYAIWNKIPFEIIPIFPNSIDIDADYLLVGVQGFDNNKDQVAGIGFNSQRITCQGLGCTGACTTISKCKGKIRNNKCIQCRRDQVQKDDGSCQFIIPSCGMNEKYSLANKKCQCQYGYKHVLHKQQNKLVCMQICDRSVQFYDGTTCICKPNIIKINNICRQCPTDSKYQNNLCRCLDTNYTWNSTSNTCNLIYPCVPRSSYNKQTKQCQCNNAQQHIIQGQCRRCKQTQEYKNNECLCKDGLVRVGQQCIEQCDINGLYSFDKKQCVCKDGYYKDRSGKKQKCSRCYPSCGTCDGAGSRNCLTCSDPVLYQYKQGECKLKPIDCPFGQYPNVGKDNKCENCSQFCNQCKSKQKCDVCALGFEPITFDNQVYCKQICGDGIVHGDQCDDGNTNPKDGCSPICRVEKGYLCKTVNGKSQCRRIRQVTPVDGGSLIQRGDAKDAISQGSDGVNVIVDGVLINQASNLNTVYPNFGVDVPVDKNTAQTDIQRAVPIFTIKTNQQDVKTGESIVQGTLPIVTSDTFLNNPEPIVNTGMIYNTKQKCKISKQGSLISLGVVMQGYTIDNLPSNLLQDSCPLCSKLLQVKIMQSLIVPGIKIQYTPNSSPSRFLINFDFGSLASPPPFTYRIRINPDYKEYFTKQEMDNQEISQIDPAVLIKRNTNKQFGLDIQDVMDLKNGFTKDQELYLFEGEYNGF